MDVRLLIGVVFVVIGVLLIATGLIMPPAEVRVASMALNLDLVWGGAMVGFGLGAVAFALMGRRR